MRPRFLIGTLALALGSAGMAFGQSAHIALATEKSTQKSWMPRRTTDGATRICRGIGPTLPTRRSNVQKS